MRLRNSRNLENKEFYLIYEMRLKALDSSTGSMLYLDMATFSLKIPKTFLAYKEILVDDDDYERIRRINWAINSSSRGNGIRGHVSGIGTVSLANFILRVGREIRVDHKNRDYSDNRKENLRICTHQQNSFNKGLQINNTSGYKGVLFHKRDKRWVAMIGINGKQKSLGYFSSPEKAARAYDEAAKRYFGEFAYLNFPDKDNG